MGLATLSSCCRPVRGRIRAYFQQTFLTTPIPTFSGFSMRCAKRQEFRTTLGCSSLLHHFGNLTGFNKRKSLAVSIRKSVLELQKKIEPALTLRRNSGLRKLRGCTILLSFRKRLSRPALLLADLLGKPGNRFSFLGAVLQIESTEPFALRSRQERGGPVSLSRGSHILPPSDHHISHDSNRPGKSYQHG
jgi:hypothetical protein